MAWNRTRRVVEFCPVISETSAVTKGKIYKEQRKLQDIIKKLECQRVNAERRFDLVKRSIRQELKTKVNTRTITLDAVDLPKLKRLGLENAPRQVIQFFINLFPTLFSQDNQDFGFTDGEGEGGGDGGLTEETLLHGMMTLFGLETAGKKPLTPAQSVDKLIREKNITFMRTNFECKERYRKEHITFDPSLSLRQREYLLRQRSAKSANRSQTSRSKYRQVHKDEITINSSKPVQKVLFPANVMIAGKMPTAWRCPVFEIDNFVGHVTNGASNLITGETNHVEDELLSNAELESSRRDRAKAFFEAVMKELGAEREAEGPHTLRPRLTPDGRRRKDVLKVVGELLQRSKTFPGTDTNMIGNSKKEVFAPQNPRGESYPPGQKPHDAQTTSSKLVKGLSLRIRKKYLHEPRRQMYIRNVTQEKVMANRLINKRSRSHDRTLPPGKSTAPSLMGWHTVMENSAHVSQRRNTFGIFL